MSRAIATGLWVVGWLGVGTLGYSLAQQTSIQKDMNQMMSVINQSIVSTGVIVQKTSATLQPLYDTTKSLADIEQKEQQVVANLTAMNNSLERIGRSEEGIITGLEQLNGYTATVKQRLIAMDSLNGRIYSTNSLSAGQAVQQTQKVGQLNQMTIQSIKEMQQLNSKTAPLANLP